MRAGRGRPGRCRFPALLRGEEGQSLVLVLVFMTVLLGMTAVVLDAGDWWWTKRKEQAVVDAAALAAAQALPADPAAARDIAITYAGKNGVALSPSEVTFSTFSVTDDTVTVSIERPSPGFFSRLFGIGSVQIGAHASARAGTPGAAQWVAPITVPTTNPMLDPTTCSPPPCTGETTITLQDLHTPGSGGGAGSFSLLDLMPNDGGNQGQSTVAGWMSSGYDQYMPLSSASNTYTAEPSTMFNGSSFQTALQGQTGTGNVVLLPVYQPPIVQSGSNAVFDIVGWVGFVIDSETATGSSGQLTGHFVSYIAQGIQAPGWNSDSNGVRVIQLVA